MATLINITTSWQDVAPGPAVFTIKSAGDGEILFNTTEDDSTANNAVRLHGEQLKQTAGVTTKCRATGAGWSIVVDEDV